ncbi:hypothetical protein B7755_052200 [Streptomyces sp. NBS 14/10]|uniref:hypothetical protein n=1 Tax=Streptomyces sp. NBS 14/10 TaxID=1945643 RepID=UPI000B7EE35B|nr:hypothetical protein [Streptomyces sp. NBS 14/10]KAK1176682.1 hypothetical protein B7755_052200 [Streptomyces sp. NBS 14/10]
MPQAQDREIPLERLSGQHSGPADLDKRQRILSRLRRFGPGPAGWYADICTLLDEDLPLRSTGMLVSHLFRELESALREVLQPDAIRNDPTAGAGKRHVFEVQGVLDWLGIPADNPAAIVWLAEARKLHTYAHRVRMEQTPMDAAVRVRLAELEDMLDVVLDRFETRYVTVLQRLETLAAVRDPGKAHVKLLLNAFPQDYLTQERFFGLLDAPRWLPHLREYGFFSTPPAPETDDEARTVVFPAWPASTYLVRMTSVAPAGVAAIAEQIPSTDNPRVNLDLAEVALLLPSADAARLVPRAVEAIRGPYLIAPDRYAQLAVHCAQGGHTEQALAVMTALLQAAQHGGRIDDYDLQENLRSHNTTLARHLGAAWLEALTDSLASALLATGMDPDRAGGEDMSGVWFPVLDPGHGGMRSDDRALFTEAVRDTADHLAATDIRRVLSILESQPWLVFRRLRLHILQRHGAHAPDVVESVLTDPDQIASARSRREWALLARACASSLGPAALEGVLAVIDAGPDTERFVERLRSTSGGAEPPEQYVEQWAGAWQRDRYAALADVLPEQQLRRYRELCDSLGPAPSLDRIPHPLAWSAAEEEGSPENLAAMTATELISHARQFQPTPTRFGTNAEAFCSQLQAAATSQALIYQEDAPQFAELADDHLAAVLDGFRTALQTGQQLSWATILPLVQSAPSRPHTSDTGILHLAVARFVLAGLGLQNTQQIPTLLGDALWDVLESVWSAARSPQDDLDDDQQSVRDESVETALRAAVAWALWRREHGAAFQALFAALDTLLLDAAGTPAAPSASSIGRTVGSLITRLDALDPAWTRRRIEVLFNLDTALGRASWMAHLNTSSPTASVVSLLMEVYRTAARTPAVDSQDHRDLHRRLGDHLMAIYLAGLLGLDDESTMADYLYSSPAAGVQLASFLSEVVHDRNLPPDTRDRIMQWWTWRLTARDDSAHGPAPQPEEIHALIGPLARNDAFPVTWRLEQPSVALETTGSLGRDRRIYSFLAEAATDYLGPVLELMHRWVTTLDMYDYAPRIRENDIRAVLLAGLASPEHQELARDIINRATYRGHYQFAPLLTDTADQPGGPEPTHQQGGR